MHGTKLLGAILPNASTVHAQDHPFPHHRQGNTDKMHHTCEHKTEKV